MSWRRGPLLIDALVGAGLLVGGMLEIWLPLPSKVGAGSDVGASAVAVVMCAGVALRRTWPLGALLVTAGVWPVAVTFAPLPVLFWGGFVPLVLAMYSVARYGSRRDGVVGGLVMAAALISLDLRVPALQDPGEIVFHWLVLTVAWTLGRIVMQREEQARAERIRADTAVIAERARIARELHDVVAHAVSLMVVQAGAGELAVDDDPAAAKRALASIRHTGKDAMAEMRRLLGIMRADADVASRSPQPGLSAVPLLVERASQRGLQVDLSVVGTPRELAAGVDLAAYRILQEAITNVCRHATATRAEVCVAYDADGVDIKVSDDGRGAPAGAPVPGGHGLVGMRERVALYGGRLEAGPRQGDAGSAGFVVHAYLPTGSLSR